MRGEGTIVYEDGGGGSERMDVEQIEYTHNILRRLEYQI